MAALGQAAVAEPMGLKGKRARQSVTAVVEAPDRFVEHPIWGPLAHALIAEASGPTPREIHYRTWGDDIDTQAHAQMRQACQVPSAAAAALMPDAHVGYGLPIGGVLALENAVIPYAVGVDIACRMKLSVLDMPVETLNRRLNRLQGSARRRNAVSASAARFDTPQIARRDGPRLERHPDHPREERHRLAAAGHVRARATILSSSVC